MFYQDMSDTGVWNTLNQTLVNTVTSALLMCSAYFMMSGLVDFQRRFSCDQKHWWNSPVYLTKNPFSVLFFLLYIWFLRN